MAVVLAGCPQPPRTDGKPKSCLERGGYCLCRVFANAKQRCVDKGEGWRWGIDVQG